MAVQINQREEDSEIKEKVGEKKRQEGELLIAVLNWLLSTVCSVELQPKRKSFSSLVQLSQPVPGFYYTAGLNATHGLAW